MFKTILFIVMAMLCLNFNTKAQENKAVDVTSKGIQIGQKVPDITITNLHNYKDKNGKTATTAKLSDFKGRLLILDFWATWCSPCVAMIPKMDSLQKQFGDKIQFLSVTYQTEKEVLPFLEKYEKQKGKHYDLPVVTDSKELHKLFPHTTLPHYVLINKDGIVKAITEYTEITEKNIQAILNSEALTIQEKKDTALTLYNSDQPLFIAANGGIGTTLIYHSLLTGYSPGISTGYDFNEYKPDGKSIKITARNYSIVQLYKLAYGQGLRFYNSNTLAVETTDSVNITPPQYSGVQYEDWQHKNTYCYELIVPNSMGKQAFSIMQNDLEKYFSTYSAKVEKRKVPCLALIRTSHKDKFRSSVVTQTFHFDRFGCTMLGFPVAAFIRQLNAFYMQGSPIPVIDATAYKGLIDLKLDCSLSDINAVNKALSKYDLQFVHTKRRVDMLVIKNSSNNDFHPVESQVNKNTQKDRLSK